MRDTCQKLPWVPEWIWIARSGAGFCHSRDSDVAVIDAVLEDQGCEVVWKAMTRRRGAEWKHQPNADTAESLRPNVARIFFGRLASLARGLTPEDRVPKAARERQGRRIAELANTLRTTLLDSRIAPAEWPHPFGIELSNSVALRYLEGADNTWWVREAAFDPNEALNSLCEMLRHLERPAKAWAGWESSVGKPGAARADRLHFIRGLTYFFRHVYGAPLREPVAALTRCVFRCDMDVSTVAKLAP